MVARDEANAALEGTTDAPDTRDDHTKLLVRDPKGHFGGSSSTHSQHSDESSGESGNTRGESQHKPGSDVSSQGFSSEQHGEKNPHGSSVVAGEGATSGNRACKTKGNKKKTTPSKHSTNGAAEEADECEEENGAKKMYRVTIKSKFFSKKSVNRNVYRTLKKEVKGSKITTDGLDDTLVQGYILEMTAHQAKEVETQLKTYVKVDPEDDTSTSRHGTSKTGKTGASHETAKTGKTHRKRSMDLRRRLADMVRLVKRVGEHWKTQRPLGSGRHAQEVSNALRFISQQAQDDNQVRMSREAPPEYHYEREAGHEIIVYLADTGAEQNHPEFVDLRKPFRFVGPNWDVANTRTNPALHDEANHQALDGTAGDFGNGVNVYHGTTMLAALAGRTLGTARLVTPIIVRKDTRLTGETVIEDYWGWLRSLEWVLRDWKLRKQQNPALRNTISIYNLSGGFEISRREGMTNEDDQAKREQFNAVLHDIVLVLNLMADEGIVCLTQSNKLADTRSLDKTNEAF